MAEYIEREAAIAETRKPRLTDAELRRRLASIPAADVRPVRRGKWNIVKLPPDPGYKAKECSACKCNFWDLEEWNFCPNCGAVMREEQDGR